MNHSERPSHVRNAVENNDTAALSAAGKVGAQKTYEIRTIKKFLGDERAETQLADAKAHEAFLLEHIPEDDR